MVRRSKDDTAQTHERLLEAALSLFAEKGYSCTTLEDIAHQVGMSRGAVYWHFEDKSALLAALIDFVYFEKAKLVITWLEDVGSLDELKQVFLDVTDLINSDDFAFFKNCHAEWLNGFRAGTEADLTLGKVQVFSQLVLTLSRASVSGGFKANMAPRQIAVILIGLWAGWARVSPDIISLEDLRKMASCGFDVVMNGVLTDEARYAPAV
jgi:AcrR family transcriptional regulator